MGIPQPMQDDPFHQVIKGMIDELVAIKDYRTRAYLIDDPDTAELYTDIMNEEIVHFGEFLKQAIKLYPPMKDFLLKGMKENDSKEDEIEEAVEE